MVSNVGESPFEVGDIMNFLGEFTNHNELG